MRSLLAVVLLGLAGCNVGMDTVYTDHYLESEKKCMTMGGLDYIRDNEYRTAVSTLTSYYYNVEVRCKDGTSIKFYLTVER